MLSPVPGDLFGDYPSVWLETLDAQSKMYKLILCQISDAHSSAEKPQSGRKGLPGWVNLPEPR